MHERNPSSMIEHSGYSLAEEAYRIIEEMIVTLELAPGAFVTEQALCEKIGIGRTPVREALVRLKQDGLMEIIPRRGIQIQPIETGESLMTLELRHLVEALIVERAARLSGDLDRQRLRRMADAMEEAAREGDALAFMRIDRAFNDLVARCAQHKAAEKAIAPLHAVSRRLGVYYAGETGRGLNGTGHAHAEIMRAIAAGDPETAREGLQTLLGLTRDIALAIEDERMSGRAAHSSGRPGS